MNIYYFRFGVVCTFVSNEYLEDGVKELPSNVKKSLNDTRLFLNNTKNVRNTIFFLKKICYYIMSKMFRKLIIC